MLGLELAGDRYSKAEHRRGLLGKLNGRSAPAVEFKYANISAVLDEFGLPYIVGYKPRGNYQNALRETVELYLETHATATDRIENTATERAQATLISSTGRQRLEDVLEDAPTLDGTSRSSAANSPARIDWAGRDESNRRLGRQGEEYIADLERRHLAEIGKADLASRAEVISATLGDGVGYDILSFFDDGRKKYVEVKTTAGGIGRPFYISRAELEVSRTLLDQYVLYRVFRREERFRVYIIPGPIDRCLHLEPVNFRAWPNRNHED